MNELIDGWLKLWNGDLDRAQDIATPTFRMHAALLGDASDTTITGPAGLAAWTGQTRAAFSELTFTIEVGPIAQDDLIALRWVARGTYGGGFPGAAAEIGTPIEFTGADFLRLVNGRIDEYWVNSDIHVLLAQLKVGAPA
jgi:predicted ester cyclase